MTPHQRNLFLLATKQGGFFNLAQAEAAGIHRKNLSYYTKKGEWIKVERGIYRLADIPKKSSDIFFLYWLWSQNKQGVPEGVISHVSALILHNLISEATLTALQEAIRPAMVFLTMPMSYERKIDPPEAVKILKSRLNQSLDIVLIDGALPTTSVMRTLSDLVSQNDSSIKSIIEEAYLRARMLSLISKEQVKEIIKSAKNEMADVIQKTEKKYEKTQF
jgi:predicted transcriptional regulator of viral defense system